MIPFCRTVEEAELVTNLMAQEGLARSKDFKVWLMAEIPSNIILADQFNKYVDGYSIGSNDLTMLVLGCDRDNETVQHIYDERNLAVRRAIVTSLRWPIKMVKLYLSVAKRQAYILNFANSL